MITEKNRTIYQPSLLQASEIQKLCVQTILHSCKGDYTPQQLQVWSQAVDNTPKWEQTIQEQYFLVAEEEGELLGFATLKDKAYIDYLYVSHQHLRQGIAQQLLYALVQQAKKEGTAHITTDASKTACPFFEQQGFELIQVNHPTLQGVALENYTMSKSLL